MCEQHRTCAAASIFCASPMRSLASADFSSPSDYLETASWLTRPEIKRNLLKVIDHEAAGEARSTPQFKSMNKWVATYDAVDDFIIKNRAGILRVLDHEAAGDYRSSAPFKNANSWVKYLGKKWYFGYLF